MNVRASSIDEGINRYYQSCASENVQLMHDTEPNASFQRSFFINCD